MISLFSAIARALRAWRYVEDNAQPAPADESKLERLREQLIERRKSAARLWLFHMHREADAKDEEAEAILKEIAQLQARLRRPAA